MFSREKSSRGSDSPRRPTRSDLRNFIASSVGRLRNSPGRIFQRLVAHTDSRKHCSVKPLKWATRVVFRHWLPISSRRACESRGACGTRPRELSNPLGTLGTQTILRRNRNTSDPLLYPRLEIFDGCYAISALVRCCRRRRWWITCSGRFMR